MHCTIHQLEIFLKVYEHQSITQASKNLHLSQPAVSIQLKKLQEQFDIPLFDYIGRGISITEFGEEVAQSAKAILDEYKNLSSKADLHKNLLTGKLKIMSVSTGKYIIPYLLTDFIKQHPTIELKLDVKNKQEVERALEKNEVDFALVSEIPEKMNLEFETLMDNRLFMIGDKHCKIDKINDLESFINNNQIIFREQGSATRNNMERFFKESKIKVDVKIELTSNEAIKQAVMAGLGYSIMPQIGIVNELDNKSLKIIEVEGLPIITSWNIVWLKGKNLSPVAERYLSYIQSQKSRMTSSIINPK